MKHIQKLSVALLLAMPLISFTKDQQKTDERNIDFNLDVDDQTYELFRDIKPAPTTNKAAKAELQQASQKPATTTKPATPAQQTQPAQEAKPAAPKKTSGLSQEQLRRRQIETNIFATRDAIEAKKALIAQLVADAVIRKSDTAYWSTEKTTLEQKKATIDQSKKIIDRATVLGGVAALMPAAIYAGQRVSDVCKTIVEKTSSHVAQYPLIAIPATLVMVGLTVAGRTESETLTKKSELLTVDIEAATNKQTWVETQLTVNQESLTKHEEELNNLEQQLQQLEADLRK